jgi:hypothetical protein
MIVDKKKFWILIPGYLYTQYCLLSTLQVTTCFDDITVLASKSDKPHDHCDCILRRLGATASKPQLPKRPLEIWTTVTDTLYIVTAI